MNQSISKLVLEQAQSVGAAQHELSKAASALQAKAAELKDDLENEDLKSEVETLTKAHETAKAALDSAEAKQKTLEQLQDIEKANSQPIKPADNGPAVIPSRKKDPRDPVDSMFITAAAKFIGYVRQERPDDILAKHYGENSAELAIHKHLDTIQKTGVAPADTTTAGWASELVDSATGALLESLTDTSVAAALRSYALSLSFQGKNSLKVPRINNRTVGDEPAWVGEGGAIPLTSFQTAAETINKYKLACITTATEELVQDAIVDIAAVFQRELRKDYAAKLDQALLSSGAAVPNIAPAGLLQGYTAVTPTGGGGSDAVIGDITKLATTLMGNNMGELPVLLVNKSDLVAASAMQSALGQFMFTEIASGRLMNYPLVASNHVPQHALIMVDAAALALAFDTPEFTVSREATIVEANADATAPTMAEDGSGDLGTRGQVPQDGGLMVNEATAAGGTASAGGYRARSMFQTYSMAIRMIAPTSFARLRPNMLAHMDSTTWTA